MAEKRGGEKQENEDPIGKLNEVARKGENIGTIC